MIDSLKVTSYTLSAGAGTASVSWMSSLRALSFRTPRFRGFAVSQVSQVAQVGFRGLVHWIFVFVVVFDLSRGTF